MHIQTAHWRLLLIGSLLTLLLSIAACSQVNPVASSESAPSDSPAFHEDDALPALIAVTLAPDERLQVIASTNIVADVVSAVGGERIELQSLMPVGADPHGFQPTPQDLIDLNEAHVIFINGLHLEEAMLSVFETLDGNGAVVSVNAGVETIGFGEGEHAHGDDVHDEHAEGEHAEDEHAEDEHAEGEHAEDEHADHHHDGADPHTWFSVHAVERWVENIEHVLATLDPAGADVYAANAAAYLTELEALDAELAVLIAEVPAEKRKLVTDHGSLGYLADAYGFEVVGSVIPSLSTLSAPSAMQLAALQEQIEAEGVDALFVGVTVNPDLAAQLAADAGVNVEMIYTGSLSDAEGPAATYLDFMRYNVRTIVEALQ